MAVAGGIEEEIAKLSPQLKAHLHDLLQSNQEFKERNEKLARQNELLARRVDFLEHVRKELARKLFGRRSERMTDLELARVQGDLFDDMREAILAEQAALGEEPEEQPAWRRGKRRRRKADTAHLEHIRKEYELGGDERGCPCCGHDMEAFGFALSEELEYRPATLFVIEHARAKYACRVCEQGMATAPGPDRPIEKGIPGPGLLAHVVASKYAHHLPLYRIEQMLGEQGYGVSRKTLCDWVARVAEMLEPVVAEQKRMLLEAPLLQSDDTRLPYQDRRCPGKTASGYLWTYTKPWGEVVYDFTESRSREGPLSMLEGFRGHLQTDACASYNEVVRENDLGQIGCMAHVRRKFFEARGEAPPEAELVLAVIGKAYRSERKAKQMGLVGEARVEYRRGHVLPLLEELEEIFKKIATYALPQSLLGRAVSYARGNWEAIKRYVEVAEAEIDNNSAEHTMKPAVLGRKNYLFAGSAEGGKRAAILYSLVVSCKRLEINPNEYLRDVIERVATHPNRRIAELTPRGWKQARAAQAAA